MPDYGHDLMFGAMLEPERAADAVALAVLAEQVGLDAVSLADHPYWPERLDTFALLAYIAARTDRVRVFPNLANLPLRPPAMLARTAATLDVLSDGRFELGIGSGAQQMWDAIVAEGGPLRSLFGAVPLRRQDRSGAGACDRRPHRDLQRHPSNRRSIGWPKGVASWSVTRRTMRGWRETATPRGPARPPDGSPSAAELTPGPGVGRGFLAPEVEQRSLAVYEEVADVAAI